MKNLLQTLLKFIVNPLEERGRIWGGRKRADNEHRRVPKQLCLPSVLLKILPKAQAPTFIYLICCFADLSLSPVFISSEPFSLLLLLKHCRRDGKMFYKAEVRDSQVWLKVTPGDASFLWTFSCSVSELYTPTCPVSHICVKSVPHS